MPKAEPEPLIPDADRKERCDLCRYYVAEGAAAGRCHRYPPLRADPSAERAARSAWHLPVVPPDNFCGEWAKQQ